MYDQWSLYKCTLARKNIILFIADWESTFTNSPAIFSVEMGNESLTKKIEILLIFIYGKNESG